VVNTPTVTFANAVTAVAMPQANLTAQLLGLGGATADSYNRLSINTPAMLFNNAGAGIEATVNKAAPANDAAFAFKTGFSVRALIGLLGSDDFSLKVSPNGSTFFDAMKIDRANGQMELPQPTILPGLNAAPSPPPADKIAVYARNRAGAPWVDVMRPSGRDFPLQPHLGVNRIANWSPSVPAQAEGRVSHNGVERGLLGRIHLPKHVPLVLEGVAVENLELGVLHPMQQHVHAGKVVGRDVAFLPENLADAVRPHALAHVKQQ